MSHLVVTAHRVQRCTIPAEKSSFTFGLSVMKSPLGGFGCFATVVFPETSRIAPYVGEKITHAEAVQRMKGANGKHISQLDADYYVDGRVDGNETQFINHSCEPNADALIEDGLLVVYALQEILPGDEITVDYLNSFDEDRTVCQCRSALCRQNK